MSLSLAGVARQESRVQVAFNSVCLNLFYNVMHFYINQIQTFASSWMKWSSHSGQICLICKLLSLPSQLVWTLSSHLTGESTVQNPWTTHCITLLYFAYIFSSSWAIVLQIFWGSVNLSTLAAFSFVSTVLVPGHFHRNWAFSFSSSSSFFVFDQPLNIDQRIIKKGANQCCVYT